MTNICHNDVCKLKCSLYGFKQAFLRSFKTPFLTSLLLSYYFAISIMIILLYVDDIVIIGIDSELVLKLQEDAKQKPFT
ncbi:hypothetical protein CR513_21530, partial [Mucuna pruriens]